MYSWVTQEQWLILSIIGLLVFLKKFNYSEGIFSEYNKLLTLFIPVFILMLVGSLMELIGVNKRYISLHSDVCSVYGFIVLIYSVYWKCKLGCVSKTTRVCLIVASVCIAIFLFLEYWF